MTSCKALLVVVLGAAACNAGAGMREPDEYLGCATDENWAAFDRAQDIISSAEAPVLSAPSSAARLGAAPVDFTWTASSAIAGATVGDVPADCPQWSPGLSTLHLPPISGTVYDLQLWVADELEHRVLTSLQTWRPSAAVWSALAGKTISLKLRRMILSKNARAEGPYAAPAAPSFTVE